MASRLPEPAVSRRALVVSAAVVWGFVGGFLCVRAAFWFGPPNAGVFGLVALALAAGYLKGRFIFSRLALRNIRRIRELSPHKEKICVFAFQAIHSYVIVAAMMTLGILLRHSPIPREILAVIYLAIGAALIYGSLPYWRAGRGNR